MDFFFFLLVYLWYKIYIDFLALFLEVDWFVDIFIPFTSLFLVVFVLLLTL